MHLFYTPDITGKTYLLSEEVSKNAVRVLRLSKEDTIGLLDGKGGLYTAKIVDDNPKRCSVEILGTEQQEQGTHRIHIAVAPTKNMDRMEWFVEKATEIGIDEITMLHCRNSERPVLKMDRLEKVAVAAMKQSMKTYLPKLNPMMDSEQFAKEFVNSENGKFIAHCSGERSELKELIKNTKHNIVMIGPEGDFTEKEINTANQNGFVSVSLGKSRLRTETAALVACHTLNLIHS
jgi:16S rRNA (uracil1498-N3)-methyltransferase